MSDEDAVWREHQRWERQRRAPVPLDEQRRFVARIRQKRIDRERLRQEILRARDAVLADFARWERERKERGE